jgi:hypothetical protein
MCKMKNVITKAPIPSSAIFTLGLAFEPFKEFGGASCTHTCTIIDGLTHFLLEVNLSIWMLIINSWKHIRDN